MALRFELEQPRGMEFGPQISELMQVIDGFNTADQEEKIILDFGQINFVYPLFILALSSLIYKYKELGFNIQLDNLDGSGSASYLESIYFPSGFRPDQSKTWSIDLDYFRGKSYLPILNFSALKSDRDTEVRNNCLSNLTLLS